MFTGIVEDKVRVINRSNTGIEIARPKIFSDLQKGQSIALNGACLTLIDFDQEKLKFDIVPETFRRTNLGSAEIVNVERALKADGRFEGHVVQGHIDGFLELLERKKEGEGEFFTFKKPVEYAKYFTEKGSIALNGVSLTIAKEDQDTFGVALIPHTLEITNFGKMKTGDLINFECDIFAKLLYKWHCDEQKQ